MLPIYDKNRSTKTPIVTWTILTINIASFILQLRVGFERSIIDYGFLPSLFLKGQEQFRLITSMFLHGGLLHLAGNMLFLYIFGDNVESRLGHVKFLFAYLVMGIFASYIHTLWATTQGLGALQVPAIGASGAISGVLGSYIVLYPHARIVTLLLLRFYIDIIEIPAFAYLGFWFLYQLILGSLDLGGEVAYWAHIGGFVAGVLAGLLSRLAYSR